MTFRRAIKQVDWLAKEERDCNNSNFAIMFVLFDISNLRDIRIKFAATYQGPIQASHDEQYYHFDRNMTFHYVRCNHNSYTNLTVILND